MGPYSCTTGVNFELLTDILATHLGDTQTNVNASTKVLLLNLHAAASVSNPTSGGVTPTEEQLPREANSLSSIISANNSGYLYTPTDLLEQRDDLNTTQDWFGVRYEYRPDPVYFTITDDDTHSSTPNGWPSENFVEMADGERMLFGFGSVDPQMSGYNFTFDTDDIFPAGYLNYIPAVSLGSTGVTSGCYYKAGVTTVSAVNNSWAAVSLNSTSLSDVLLDAGNLTACGISPVLNTTLANVTAAQDYRPYEAFVSSTIWSWAAGEPRPNSTDSDITFNCAALNATSGLWQARDCSETHYGACRIADQPYEWRITNAQGQYYNVNLGCEYNTSFTTPRTALENSYLLGTWRNFVADQEDGDDPLLWLNFNDLDTSTCWVVGQNATCPYVNQQKDETRQVIVPTVAGIIVLVIAGLTIFVKCAANRQNSKRKRRRSNEAYDYEGVPS
jgi:hypothetical protein